MKIVTAEQMRAIEQKSAEAGVPPSVLMENAGRAVAAEMARFLGGVSGRRVLVLVGPGNNGGDGLVAARYLHDAGARVVLYLLKVRGPEDTNFARTQERRVPAYDAQSDKRLVQLENLLSASGVVVDAVFGTGKSRALSGVYQAVLERLGRSRQQGRRVLVAVDLPSGLDPDTGAVDEACPVADLTVTLGYPKPGLFRFPGAERVGRLVVADIGIPPGLAEDVAVELITDGWVTSVLPRRPLDANKGTFGRVLVVAGSINYAGAAYLATMGAARAGAGLVTLATAASLYPVLAAKLTEATHHPLPEAAPGVIGSAAAAALADVWQASDAVLIGCGLGQHAGVVALIESVVAGLAQAGAGPRMVLDADALNILGRWPRWWERLELDCILTPHPGEMARLAGCTVEQVQRDRTGLAQRCAALWHKTIVLKGAFTVVAAPDGRVRLSGSANPGLASAGTGDVLAGVVAGLVAQGLPLFEAGACGVALHARAGEAVKAELGDAGMLAGDLLPALPGAIKGLKCQ